MPPDGVTGRLLRTAGCWGLPLVSQGDPKLVNLACSPQWLARRAVQWMQLGMMGNSGTAPECAHPTHAAVAADRGMGKKA